MLNPNLTLADLTPGDRAAFGEHDPEIVTLPPNFRLFKLTQYGLLNPNRDMGQQLSKWWSPVFPYLQDHLGAIGRYMEAQTNQVTMREMVRFASAVCIDWNDLDNYLEVVTLDYIQCFWGTFAPQNMISPEAEHIDPNRQATALRKAQDALNLAERRGVYVPEALGGIDAWQFCIPNLTIEYVEERATIPSHNMAALAVHLNA